MTKKKHAKIFVVALCATVFLNMFVLLDTPAVYAASPDLFISEYIEGSSNNKAIEIYNNTGSSVDLAASGYGIWMYFNGNPSATLKILLSGSIPAHGTFVLAHSSANATILAEADQTNAAGWFNGNDSVALIKGTTIVDCIGTIGVDPGAAWDDGQASTVNRTLVRKPNITQGDTNSANGFIPSAEWISYTVDTSSNLGSHALSEFTVTFDLGTHGTLVTGSQLQTITIGDNAIPPTVQANQGYTFTGWEGIYNDVQSNLTITAQYTRNTYNVEFVEGTNGKVDPSGQPATQQVLYGDSAAAPTIVTDPGYTFTGWDTSFDSVSSNLTVTAQYTQNTYSVVFKIGDGAIFHTNGGEQEQLLHYGNVIAKPEDPTRTGYSFTGWYTDADYTEEYLFDGGIKSNLVLYAKWTESKSQGFPYTGSPSNGFPNTGDDSNLMILLVLCLLSLLGMGFQFSKLRRS